LEQHGEDTVKKTLKDYSAVLESDTEHFLHDKAIEMEKRALARTYLAMDEDDDIIGHVTIGIKCLKIENTDEIDRKTAHRMNIDERNMVAQCYLLGQLSRSAKAPKGFGKMLLEVAFGELRVAKEKVGCRTLRLDCHDEPIPYYENTGSSSYPRTGKVP